MLEGEENLCAKDQNNTKHARVRWVERGFLVSCNPKTVSLNRSVPQIEKFRGFGS